MPYAEYLPLPQLEGIICCFWSLDRAAGDDADSSDAPFRHWPDPHTELIVHSGMQYSVIDDGSRLPLPAVAIIPPHRRPLLLHADGPVTIIGVRFEPWSIHRFLRAPLSELVDQIHPYDEVWRDPVPLADWLLERPVAEWIAVLQLYFLRHAVAGNDRTADVVGMIHARRGNVTVADLLEYTSLNPRTLQRVFLNEIGYPPKLYIRLVRFNYARHRLQIEPDIRLAELALECGYADQSHFTNNFRELFGITPQVFQEEMRSLTRDVGR